MTDADANRAKARIRGTLAAQLHTAAQLVKSRDQVALARAFPPASRRGEYAKRRSGRLMQSSDFGPKSMEEIARVQRVYFFRRARHDKYLVAKGRLSVQDTVERLRGQLATMFAGASGGPPGVAVG